jgi:hypothetical protein
VLVQSADKRFFRQRSGDDVPSTLENTEFALAANGAKSFTCSLKMSPGLSEQEYSGCVSEGFNVNPTNPIGSCIAKFLSEQFFSAGFEDEK